MEKYIRAELFEMATKTGASLTIEKGVDLEIINALMLTGQTLLKKCMKKIISTSTRGS